jgi:exodeoxyribonuclease VII small subunit
VPKKPLKKDEADLAALSFEGAMLRVEEIIARIESGEVGLEGSIDEYERGVALVARCREILAKAEQRVEDLTERMRREPAD